MNKEYAKYPFRYMNITQRHDQGSHIPNWKDSNNYIDLPWDDALQDEGRGYFEPKNDFLVEEVLGIGNDITNTVRLKSVNKLYIPYKKEPDYLYVTLSHMNEDNLSQIKKGQILKKGSKILLEGTDGFATGNHFHITANIGTYYGFLQNSNGAWCFTYENSLLPHEAFYLDLTYTSVLNNAGYAFVDVPKEFSIVGNPVSRDDKVNQIEIKAKDLYFRVNPGLSSEVLGYIAPGIYNYNEVIEKDGYIWYHIGIGWVAHDSTWSELYPKLETTLPPINEDNINEKKQNIFQRIISKIVHFFKNIFKLK